MHRIALDLPRQEIQEGLSKADHAKKSPIMFRHFATMSQHLCWWQCSRELAILAKSHANKQPSLGAQQGVPHEAHHCLLAIFKNQRQNRLMPRAAQYNIHHASQLCVKIERHDLCRSATRLEYLSASRA